VLAVVVHRLTGPGAGQDGQRFVEHPAPLAVVEFLPGLGQFACEPVGADADAEAEPPAAEPVQRRGLARPSPVGGEEAA